MKARITVAAMVLVSFLPCPPVAAQQRVSPDGDRLRLSLSHRATDPFGVQHQALDRTISLSFRNLTLEQALDTISETAGFEITYSPDLIPLTKRVSMNDASVRARDALKHVLAGEPLRFLVGPSGHVVLAEARPAQGVEAPAPVAQGAISGRVTDAASGLGLDGVSVIVEGTSRGAVTNRTGQYQISDVPVGTHTVIARRLNYATASRSVTVSEGERTEVHFELEVSAIELDEMVVTGNLVETRMREMTHPVTVLTEDEIEIKQITRVSDLLRGSVPGVIVLHEGSGNEGYAPIYVRGTAGRSKVIKTYIDGVEVASYGHALTTIDPNMIERVEIIRGPQASTLYGSDAMAGVLQIFTKKGADLGLDRPRIVAKTSMGVIESDFTPDGVPLLQEHSLTVSGGGPSFSYSLGGMVLSKGEWYREFHTDERSFSGAIRANHGPFDLEVSARQYTRDYVLGLQPNLRAWFPDTFDYDNDLPVNQRQMTASLNMGYRVADRWRHELLIGFDQHEFAYHNTEPKYRTPSDTTVTVGSFPGNRASYRYTSSLDLSLGEAVSTGLIAGVDYWRFKETSLYTSSAVRNEGTLDQSDARITRDAYANIGYFAQVNAGIRDRIFINAGLRAEDNDNFGADHGLAWAPRVGATYVYESGDLRVKPRASYGKAIRPPEPSQRQSYATSFQMQLANPELGPEEQVGWDAGVDLLIGNRYRVSATYYDQEVRDMIQRVELDRTATPPLIQYQNIGRLANSGWELEGGVDLAPFSLEFTFTTMNSTVRELGPRYTGDLEVGDRNLAVPERSGGATLTYSFLRGSASLEATYIGERVNTDYEALFGVFYGGDDYRGSGRAYWITYEPITKLNLRFEQALTDRVGVFGRIDNLTDDQRGEAYNFVVYPGRTAVVGLRLTY